ncbi:MAG: hypothetical protein NC337_15545 [Roseburia sp.]|nr:hypothetical protein [Roseburia sp.]
MTTDEKELELEAQEDEAGSAAPQNDDFKYVLQDVSSLYLGRELTYAEMLEREDVPFKLKAIINGYIQKDAGLEKTITEHLLEITPEQFSYKVYEQLKLSVKVCGAAKKRLRVFGGRNKWAHKSYTIRQFCETCQAAAAAGDVRIEEISVSKLALMVINI